MSEKMLYEVSEVLLIVGGLNWGLSEFFSVNLVTLLLGSIPIAAQIVYGLVAASALYLAWHKWMK